MDFEKFFFSFLFLVHQDLDINKNIMVELRKYLVSSLIIIIHCLYFRFDMFISIRSVSSFFPLLCARILKKMRIFFQLVLPS